MEVITAHKQRTHEFVPFQTREKLFHLQALRGLAACLVAFSHSSDTLAARGLILQTYADRLEISGYFGVATFFIISGFIIYKTSRGSFGNAHGAGAFVLKRLIRIFPIYWIATALFILLSPHRSAYGAADVVSSLLLVPHVISSGHNMHPLVGQGWTLQYEMMFYLIFTAGLLLARRIGTLVIVAALIACVGAGLAIMPLSEVADPLTLAQFYTRPIILLFAAGIGLGVLEERLPHSFTVPHAFPLILAGIGLWFAYSLGAPLTATEQVRFPTVGLIWLLCALLVFTSIFGQRKEGASERLAEAFGDASYSIYLFHTFVLSALLRMGLHHRSPIVFAVATLVGSIVLGIAIYHLLERPILRALRGMMTRSPTSRQDSSALPRPRAAPR